MSFTRKTLSSYGLTDEQLEKVMTLHSTSLSDFILKSEAEEHEKTAVEAARKEASPAINPTETDEYKALQQENNKLKLFGSEEFSAVNPKYKDVVYGKLEFGEGAAPIPEQLSSMRENMGELFVSDSTQAKPADTAPRFGAPVTGSMPAGGSKSTLENVWFGSNK